MAINDSGEVAFIASLFACQPSNGIFTGPDPATDKVIETGDPLFGSTVDDVATFGSEGLNDAGQISFVADLADGAEVVVRADPVSVSVPEPTAWTILLLGCAVAAIARRRCSLHRRFAIIAGSLALTCSGWGEQALANLYTFTEIDGPASRTTAVSGIDDFGDMVGAYTDSTGTHGFLLSGGVFSSFDYPGTSDTEPAGISGPGTVPVRVQFPTGLRQSYLYTTFGFPHFFLGPVTVPGAVRVDVQGISPNGQNVVGGYSSVTPAFVDKGFVRLGGIISGGSLSSLSVPGASYTEAFGVNDSGTAVGYYVAGGVTNQAFEWQGGVLTNINPAVPGFSDTQTTAFGISDHGDIVGLLDTQRRGYLDSAGTFGLINVPVSNSLTEPFGINDRGQIVGTFTNSTGNHGFLLTPFGTSPTSPILPFTTSSPSACPKIVSAGTPLLCYSFRGDPTDAWYDPTAASGYAYQMTGSSLFTDILDFPTGFLAPFEVTSPGCSIPGTFGLGGSVDFVTLCGHGVSTFTVTGIDPLLDAADPAAFPLELAFNTPTADFVAEPLSSGSAVPEPSSAIIMLPGLAAIGLALRRRRSMP